MLLFNSFALVYKSILNKCLNKSTNFSQATIGKVFGINQCTYNALVSIARTKMPQQCRIRSIGLKYFAQCCKNRGY